MNSFAGNWYRAGSKSKNLLHMMILRSRIPCKLTAGKIYLMSFENFTGVRLYVMTEKVMLKQIFELLLFEHIFVLFIFSRWLKHRCRTLQFCCLFNNMVLT